MSIPISPQASARILLLLAAIILSATSLSAEQFGLFTYQNLGASIQITDYPEDAIGEVDIPAEINGLPVTSIGDHAFRNCSRLTGITIPDSVTRIDGLAWRILGDNRGAFSGCSSLTSIEIPESVTYIGFRAFSNCSSLTRIHIPEGVNSMGDATFSNCSSLTEIQLPGSLQAIPKRAFEGCRSLVAITIPPGVWFLYEDPFYGCVSLESIEVAEGNHSFTSIDGVLFKRADDFIPGSGMRLVRCPEGKVGAYTVPEGVVAITGRRRDARDFDGQSYTIQPAFRGCSQLTSIHLPASITYIGLSAFEGCGQLESIVVAEDNSTYRSHRGILYHAGMDLLVRCPEGKRGAYTIPDGVTQLGRLVPQRWFPDYYPPFSDCILLTQVNIPESIPSYQSAFPNCPAILIFEPHRVWLEEHGLAPSTDLHQDLNGDGVDLLMAYALNLDPRNARAGMPQAIMGPTTLGIEFYASAPGITYTAQTSTDMETWIPDGVTLSDMDPEGRRIATVDRSSSRRFMRLVVED